MRQSKARAMAEQGRGDGIDVTTRSPITDRMGLVHASLSRRDAICNTLATATTLAINGSQGLAHGLPNSSDQPRRFGNRGGEGTKSRATFDYETSLSNFGGRLGSPIDRLLQQSSSTMPVEYDIVIVGSGYGASICAARLASKMRPGTRIAILERGKEWVPGTFPQSFLPIVKESQRPLLGLKKRTIRNPTGLLNVLQGDDITVMSANGLGGTSLINANVAIRPDQEVFQQPEWPQSLNDRSFLDPYFDRAEWELGVQREPIDLTHKMKAQRLAAERLRDCGAHFEAAALAITRGPQLGMPIVNRQGMIQRPCTSCGDCMTGCNVGAKNTLAMNYLPIAKSFGTEMFTETEIDRIDKDQGFYSIHFTHYSNQCEKIIPISGTIRSRIVILGAGSIGSTELLLRSQNRNFQFSSRLGSRWSGNGDILGFIRRTDLRTQIGGVGAQDIVDRWIGPTIQSNVTFPLRPVLKQRVIVQDGVSAKAYNPFVSIFGRDLGLDETQILLISGHDGSHGRIELDSDGRAVIRWPGLYHHPYRKMAEGELHRFAQALGGEYQELKAFEGRVGTVHPLGGCSMGNDPGQGVINSKGQVFDGYWGGDIDPQTNEPRVHSGLYVADGAVMPTSLGVNPLLTISALAERTAEYITLEPNFADLFPF